MALESKELLLDNIKIYSDGLVIAMKQEKFFDAREYVVNLRKSLESTMDYLDSQISIAQEQDSASLITDPYEAARTNAERASLAAERSQQKADHLKIAAKKAEEESKRLKKAASKAEREAKKAKKDAEKADIDERKASKHSRKAAEHATKANQEARRS